MTSQISERVSRLLSGGDAPAALQLARVTASEQRSAEAFSALAHTCLYISAYPEALEAASAAVIAGPEEPALRFLRGRIHHILGHFRASVDDCMIGLRCSRDAHSMYYTESLRLLAAAGHVALNEAPEAIALLAPVSEVCSVMAGQLLTREGVTHQARALSRPRFSRSF